jgi:hypothetical protein
METYASWIAGYSAIAQRPDAQITRLGFEGLYHFDPLKSVEDWFHFAIPTPTVIQSKRASIWRVMFLFNATHDSAIDQVDLWDGRNQIHSEKRHIGGDHSDSIVDGQNIIAPWGNPPRHGPDIIWGLGVSIHAIAGADPGDVHFVSVGADFLADV